MLTEYAEKDFIKKWQTKEERWKQVILAACKQSEAAIIPQLNAPITFNEAIKLNRPAIMCYENENKTNMAQAIKKLNYPAEIILHIGPEGGYSPAEAAAAAKAGIIAVSLGVNILKAQTAALAACAKITG